MLRNVFFCVLLLTQLSFLATPAKAGNGCGYGYDCGIGYLYNSLRYEVPHFAAYPPVYYSYPVPRTYGYSPFAYPPHVMTPEIVGEPQAVEILNPYVPSSLEKPADGAAPDRTASLSAQPRPLVVVNPYVQPTVAQQ